jgi:hypothetical protein
VLGSVITHGNKIATFAGLLIGLAIAVGPILGGVSALRCPFCRKRVKLGATVCHHCARPVGRVQ